MKKLIFCLLGLAAVTMTATAQNESVWGVRAGMNMSNFSSEVESLNSKIGYHVGVAYQQPLMKQTPLYLETGLYLTTRGAKVDGLKFNTLYMQLPVLVSWHFKLGSVSLQPYAGAYYAFGISGKVKGDGEKVDLFKSTTVGEEEIPQMLKRSDVGLRFGVGASFCKRYYAGLGYDLGLSNISKLDDTKVKNGNFYITVGYNF